MSLVGGSSRPGYITSSGVGASIKMHSSSCSSAVDQQVVLQSRSSSRRADRKYTFPRYSSVLVQLGSEAECRNLKRCSVLGTPVSLAPNLDLGLSSGHSQLTEDQQNPQSVPDVPATGLETGCGSY